MEYIIYGGVASVVELFLLVIFVLFRTVVSTNMVHIVQRKTTTVEYGKGKEGGNVYYDWPSWVPFIGISVLKLPESIFSIQLSNYEAYDAERLPFNVDVAGFFRIENASQAAQRVASFEELNSQLIHVLQGAVRRILATNTLQEIMEARATLGNQFTAEVKDQIKEWGVLPVKSIEFMDIKDSKGSSVIDNIMAKKKSEIDRESRMTVALNKQQAESAEIDANRTIELSRQEAAEQVGLRTAQKEQKVGIAKQESIQSVTKSSIETASQEMEVVQVRVLRNAEIEKQRDIIIANNKKQQAVTDAEARLEVSRLAAAAILVTAQNEAEGALAAGKARATSEELLLMAPVTAQLTLADKIGSNESYQQYLKDIRTIESNQAIGEKMAEALSRADLKIISNGSGDNLLTGANKLTSMFSAAGGGNLSAMLAALSQTDEGKALVNGLINKLS